MANETCDKCRKPMARQKRWFRCSKCKAWFCPSCMDRFCLFCKAKVDQVPEGGGEASDGGFGAWLKSLFGG